MQNNTTTKPLNQNKMNAKLYKTEKENYVLVDPTKGTYDDGYTLGTSRESQFNKLSIKNCETIERGYDLGELAEKNTSDCDASGCYPEDVFKKGFQKALDLNNTKLYTLEDMMNCWNKALTFQDHKELFGYHIQSLKQTEWDVEVVMVPAMSNNGNVYYGDIPKLDENGCLILKRI